MVNKKNTGAGVKPAPVKFALFFRTLLLGCFLFISSISPVTAQKPSKDYSTLHQESGVLYFIYPKKGFESTKPKNEFIFDISYLDTSDSLTITYTYTDSRLLSIDSMSIRLEDAPIYLSAPAQKIYVEPSKSKWIFRNSSKFLFADFKKCLNSQVSPQLQLHCKDGIEVTIAMKDKDWRKEAVKLSRIFDTIIMNRDK